MREIVSIHIGDAGLKVGQQYWKTLAHEHSLDSNSGELIGDYNSKTEHVNKVFDENSSGVYTPRAVFVDANSLSFDQMLTDDMLFSDWQRVYGQLDKASTFAEGKYNVVAKLKNEVNDAIQRELEKWDSLDTMLAFGSTCGGTGSAFIPQISESHKNNISMIQTPSTIKTVNPIEIYNGLLWLSSMYTNQCFSIISDNYSAFEIYK